MQAEGKRYLVLVNNRRTLGPRATYPNAPEERGLETTVRITMPGVQKVTDVDTGRAVPVEGGCFAVTIAPGWGKILQYQ